MTQAQASTVTLDQIRASAEKLADAHRVTTARAKLLDEECRQAVAPIWDAHKHWMDTATEAEAKAHEVLSAQLMAAADLFKSPRSLTANGVRAGYRKAEDSLQWLDDTTLIERIKTLLPAEQAALLIRTQETLVLDAVGQLDEVTRKLLGIHLITGEDTPFITIGASDVEKTVKALMADAMRRQGDEEPAPKEKKNKTKARPAKEAA